MGCSEGATNLKVPSPPSLGHTAKGPVSEFELSEGVLASCPASGWDM